MPQSYIEYNSGLTGTTFSVPFKYISVDDVHALGYDGTYYSSLAVASRNHSAKTITLAAAPSTYTKVRVYRSTATDQLVDFQNGSRLSEADLDTAYQQGLFVAQEVSEDANTNQYVNLADAALLANTSLSEFSSSSHTGDGTEVTFDLSFVPKTSLPQAFLVIIDGILQSPVDAYTMSINPAQITFASAPPASSKIVVTTTAAATGAVLDNLDVKAKDSTEPRSLSDRFADTVSVKDFGAKGDGVTDDTSAIQAAIDSVNASGGGTVIIPSGTFIVGGSGSSQGGREYGIVIKSNVTLKGLNRNSTILKIKKDAEIDGIVTLGMSNEKIGVTNLTIDGNEVNQSLGGDRFNLWFAYVNTLTIENITSLNPSSWGIRIGNSSYVEINHIKCVHSAASNADGIHFVDTNNVTGGDIDIYTEGDDGFIIEAHTSDVSNFAIAGLNVECNLTTNQSGLRAILLIADRDIIDAPRKISNVSITGAVIKNNHGGAVELIGASYEDVSIRAVATNCAHALKCEVGTVSYAGSMRNCYFNVVGSNFTARGIRIQKGSASSVIEKNHIKALISNPADGFEGVYIAGNYWSGEINLDYDPNLDKTTKNIGVNIEGSWNNLSISSIGSSDSLYLSEWSSFNNINIGSLSGGTNSDLSLSNNCLNNNFNGGYIDGVVVSNPALNSRFSNVRRATIKKAFNVNFSSTANGEASIPHGLALTPAFVNITSGDAALQTYQVVVSTTDSTNINLKAINHSGLPLTVGTYKVFVDATI